MARVGVVVAASAWVMLSGFWKIAGLGAFRQALTDHGVIPETAVSALVIGVPVGEVVLASAALVLLVRRRLAPAALLLAALFMSFGIDASVLYHTPPSKPVACGCGLSESLVVEWAPIALRNGCAAIALIVCATVRPRCTNAKDHLA